MTTDKHTHLLDELQSLLERQIELTLQGNISDIDVLSSRADSLVAEIAQTGILESTEFKDQRDRLQRLYDSLHLTITAQQADVSEKLSRVRRGRRTVAAYHSNI